MITDEILRQKYDELRECLVGLMPLFRDSQNQAESMYVANSYSDFHRGRIVGILDCIIILQGELKRLGIIDDEDAAMAGQGR